MSVEGANPIAKQLIACIDFDDVVHPVTTNVSHGFIFVHGAANLLEVGVESPVSIMLYLKCPCMKSRQRRAIDLECAFASMKKVSLRDGVVRKSLVDRWDVPDQ
jgi:hypothetical protein